MNERTYALLGVVGPVVAYVSIGVSIALSPWFSWERNALSDLGHAVKSGVAPIFNLGISLAGLLVIIYTATTFRKHAKYTSICVVVSASMLQLLATFDEVYGFLHYVVSVLFFTSIGISSIVYATEGRSLLAVTAFIIGIGSWLLYGMKVYSAGVAVPETISSAAAVSWIMFSALKIFFKKGNASEIRTRD